MLQTSVKGLGGEGDLLGIVQEIEIWPFYQIVYTHKLESDLVNEMHEIVWENKQIS